MSSSGFLKSVLSGFADTLQPLRDAVASPDAFTAFLSQFGWTLSPTDTAKVSFGLGDVKSLAANPSAQSIEQLAADLVSMAKLVRQIANSGAPAAFASTFPRELLDYLVFFSLAGHAPGIFGILHFVGILSERRVAADPATGRGAHLHVEVHWDRLGPLADDPLTTVEQAYSWGSDFDGDGFLRSLGILIRGFGGKAGMYGADRTLVDQYYMRGSPSAAGVKNLIISTSVFDTSVTSGLASASTKLAFLGIPIPPHPDAPDPADGLAFMPLITGKAGDSFPLSDGVSLTLSGDFLSRPVRAEIHPDSATVRSSISDTKVDALARLDAKAPANTPWIAFGDATSSRLEIAASHASLGMSGTLDGDVELKVEAGLDTATLVIDLGEGDGFVQNALSSQPVRSPLSLVVKWSSHSGFSLGGQPKLGVTLPVGLSLGDIATVKSVSFALGAADGKGVALDATLTFSASIGPIGVTVQDAGIRTLITAVDNASPPGNLGNVDVQFHFKAPSGVGLVVDAAGVTGGGFVSHDEAAQTYNGVLQLQFADLALQAFALISTQGSTYSLIALVDAEFPPVQLGWGFTLNGAGGLLALNRTASVDALRAALKADQLAAVLFPKNAITNAPQILAQIGTLFPAAQGRFLFGPMVLIGWGTPTVLTAAVALVLELPEPVRLLLLARVAVRAPSDSNALVRINMDALGVLDFSRSELSLDAVLFDSKLVGFTLSGAMALRATWAQQREFLLAIGGFSPRFQPPPGFPALQRITIDMPSGIVSKLRLSAYFAITSNTVQLGADLDVAVGAFGFGLTGHLGFDALLQLHPFHFDVDISGKVAITFAGEDLASVSLDASLTGPAPWNIAGSFKIHIVFWDVHKSFSHSWGDDAADQAVAAVDVLSLLNATLIDPRSWDAQMPDGVPALVGVRGIDPGPATLLAHPLARLEVHERLVPLGLAITRFGDATPSGASSFAITDLRVNGSAVPRDSVQDDFAPAQFFELSEEEKLQRPSFERHDAGTIMTGGLVATTTPVPKTINFETLFIDSPGAQPRTDPGTPVQPLRLTDLVATLAIGAAARSGIAQAGYRRYQAPGNPVRVAEPQFVLVDSDNLTPAGVGPSTGATFSEVQAWLDGEAAQSPGRRSALRIVATHEMVAA